MGVFLAGYFVVGVVLHGSRFAIEYVRLLDDLPQPADDGRSDGPIAGTRRRP
jgi:hypothetical protein